MNLRLTQLSTSVHARNEQGRSIGLLAPMQDQHGNTLTRALSPYRELPELFYSRSAQAVKAAEFLRTTSYYQSVEAVVLEVKERRQFKVPGTGPKWKGVR